MGLLATAPFVLVVRGKHRLHAKFTIALVREGVRHAGVWAFPYLPVAICVGSSHLLSLFFVLGGESVKRRELYHHGICGQKWGKRNGPPYPLTKHSAAERKAAIDKSKRKRYNKDKSIERGRYFVGSILGKLGDKPISELDNNLNGNFKMLPKPESVNEVLRNTNPTNSHNNCYNCVVAAAARLCGLDVTAKEALSNVQGISFDEICRVFRLDPDDPKDVARLFEPSVERITKNIERRYNEGDIGAIGFAWNDNYKRQSGATVDGHTLNWVISDGKVELLDTQIGWRGNSVEGFMKANMSTDKEVSIARFATVSSNEPLTANTDLFEFKKFVR